MSSPFETESNLQVTVTSPAMDANGNATSLPIGPVRSGEIWHITLMGARGPISCKLEVFRNNFKIDGTATADNDSSACDITLRSGETLVFVWSNGTQNSVMYCDLTGTSRIHGRWS